MSFPRAQLYQATIRQYFAPQGGINLPSAGEQAASPTTHEATLDVAPLLEYRHFTPGDGQSVQPIDVEGWHDLEPFDVDAFEPGIVEVETQHLAPVDESESNVNDALMDETPIRSLQPEDQSMTAASEQSDNEADVVDEKLFQCAICVDTYTRPVVTYCMHVFCDACLRTNLGYSFACPFCRALITEPPMRDRFLEVELERAVEEGLVQPPSGSGRRRPYVWSEVRFPTP